MWAAPLIAPDIPGSERKLASRPPVLVNRFFLALIVTDVVALSLPTEWMGRRVEMGLAIALSCATALLWLCIRVRPGSH